MLVTTTQTLQNVQSIQYIGIVSGEVILGINAFKDVAAGFRNLVGGRSKGYEDEVVKGRQEAVDEMIQRATQMGANAIIGASFVITGLNQGMLIVTVTGTAVIAS